ncbi:hypothetical protein ACXN5S_03880 [Pseudoroseicyclus sp. H15]
MLSQHQYRSKVAQFLYHRPDAVAFHTLCEALLTVLERQMGCSARVEMGARRAVFFLPELTVHLDYAPAINGPWQSALTLWIDSTPGEDGSTGAAAPHLGAIRGLLISAVNAGNAPHKLVRHEMEGPASDEVLQQLQDALSASPSPSAPSSAHVVPMRPAAPAATRRETGDEAATPGARVALAPANKEPTLDNASRQKAEELRDALYVNGEAEEAPSTVLRLAAHTINASVMVIALPVGASLMVYSCLRGEDLTLSARAMAVTGMAVGLMKMAPEFGVMGF